ncbi:MAG: family 16 glycoside hydrolase [Planctomycetota bacterium]
MIPASVALLTLLGTPQSAGAAAEFATPPGLRVELGAAETEPVLALAFDARDRLFVARESGAIVALDDDDHDGVHARPVLVSDGWSQVHALLPRDDGLWLVGMRGARAGVWRLAFDARAAAAPSDVSATSDARVAVEPELVLPVLGHTEHGAQSLVATPEGHLLLSLGNSAWIDPAAPARAPMPPVDLAALHPLDEPPGTALPRAPHGCGTIVELDARDGRWSVHSYGYRNPFGLAFDAHGALWTCDNDMEWDLGCPWYRPSALVRCLRGTDRGSRTGAQPFRAGWPDALAPELDLGRAAPTAVVSGHRTNLPEPWRSAVLMGDWTGARVLALRPGAGDDAVRELLRARTTFAVTSLAVRSDGALYVASGGRGTRGRIVRVVPETLTAVHSEKETARTEREPARVDADPARTRDDAARAGDDAARALADADPERRLRACERFVGAAELAPAVRARLYERLGDDDARVRAVARAALANAIDDALRGAIARETDPRRALEGALLLARPGVEDVELRARDARIAHGVLAALLDGEFGRAHAGDVLRVVELAFLRLGPPEATARAALVARLVARFRELDPAARRTALVLLAHEGAPECAQLVANALDATGPDGARAVANGKDATTRSSSEGAGDASPRLDGFDLLVAVRDVRTGWTSALAARALAWFEAPAPPNAGASRAGYLSVVLHALLEDFGPALRAELARSNAVGPRARAALVARDEDGVSGPAFEALRAGWSALPEGDAGDALRVELLRAVRDARDPALHAWLRERLTGGLREREEAFAALCAHPEADDRALLLAGLASTTYGVPETCARALRSVARESTHADEWVRALDAAHELGAPRGWPMLELVGDWSGTPVDGQRGRAAFDRALEAAEAAFRARFPERPREPVRVNARPHWSANAVLDFLDRSAARPGSARRGRALFERATCAHCHAFTLTGGDALPPVAGAGFGPDLTGVTKRFSSAQLLESILEPSRRIADEYRSTRCVLRDESVVEGRVVREDARVLVLLGTDGRETTLEKSELEERAPSRTSAMPEGLAAAFGLEDYKDLFAFLDCGGALGPERPEDGAWTKLFEGRKRRDWDFDPARWRLDGDTLVGVAEFLEHSSYLLSKSEHGDFEVAFDVRLAGGNSGLQYRSRVEPGAEDPIGYQADLGQTYWGSLFATDGRGALATADETAWRSVVDPRGWVHVHVRARGDEQRIELGGLVLVDAHDAVHARGRFGFQLHRGLKMELRVADARLLDLDRR